MSYSTTFIRICKPAYKLSTIVLIIGAILSVIGLVINLFFNIGWMVFLIGIACFVVGIILHYISIVYLTFIIKSFGESLTTKNATKIVENHLHDRYVNNTDYFLLDYYNEVQQNKRTILPKKKEKDLENLIVYLKKRNRIRKEKG